MPIRVPQVWPVYCLHCGLSAMPNGVIHLSASILHPLSYFPNDHFPWSTNSPRKEVDMFSSHPLSVFFFPPSPCLTHKFKPQPGLLIKQWPNKRYLRDFTLEISTIMTCWRIRSLTWRKPIKVVTRIRWNYDIKGQLRADGLWLLQSLCCLPRFSMLRCAGAREHPFVRWCHSIDLCVSHFHALTPFFCEFPPILVGKSMWHAWLLRDVLPALRWEAKPRAGSGAGCLTCFTSSCIRAAGKIPELNVTAQIKVKAI